MLSNYKELQKTAITFEKEICKTFRKQECKNWHQKWTEIRLDASSLRQVV